MSNNEYGFFTSKNQDRVYTADDFVQYFKDIMTDGVLGDDTNKLAVTAGGGMSVSISAGTAYIGGRWLRRKESQTLTLSNADTVYNRWDAIAVRCDFEKRAIYLTAVEGIPSVSPVKPAPKRDESAYDIIIAYVYVDANSVEITQSDITDTRGDTNLCGWVTSAIDTIDTTALFAQYEAQWELLKAACENDAEGVINAWESLNAVKKVCNVSPVNGNVPLTMDNIAQGSTYEKYLIQSGTFSTTSAGPKTVTFPKSYISAPLVIGVYIPKDTDDSQYWRVGSCQPVTVTKSSVTLTYYRGTNFSEPTTTYPGTFRWIAIGKV
ncbi:MAG: hypothetical protein IJF18_00765 [Oscillospiraceae bacterium]|nr:hypothetical protein [Oscillospiraceae bacterium]